MGSINEKYNEIMFEKEMGSQNRDYIPKYSGDLVNRGTYFNEDWQWIEPKYRKRYLNIYEFEGKTILRSGWYKLEDADEVFEFDYQKELMLMVESFKNFSNENLEKVIYEDEEDWIYINVEILDKVIISTDKYKKDNCDECIVCLDKGEASDILFEMNNHYSEYRRVIIKDNLMVEEDGLLY